MSIESYTKIETFKGIEVRNSKLEKLFAQLKFNKKKPKYNYLSGLIAGMMVDKMTMLKPILEAQNKKDIDLIQVLLEGLIPMAKGLVEDYNWNMGNLEDLTDQFFGERD